MVWDTLTHISKILSETDSVWMAAYVVPDHVCIIKN